MVTLGKRWLVSALLLLALLVPHTALAQDGKEETLIRIGAPDHLQLGERVIVQAVLADSGGQPISQATIYFVMPATFLSGSGDMLVGRAVTNEKGQAVAEFENQLAGALTINAQFRGDDRYAPSDASAQINIAGDTQLYVERVGVQIPGLTAAPPMPVSAAVGEPTMGVTTEIQALWPSLSGWPVALALMAVWLLYLFVVGLIFTIASASPPERAGHQAETGRLE